MTLPFLYVADKDDLRTPPLVRLAQEVLSPQGRVNIMDSGRRACAPPDTTWNTHRHRSRSAGTDTLLRAHRNQTTSERLSACCAPILGVLWILRKFC